MKEPPTQRALPADEDASADLEARLARLRSRLAAEGRGSAVRTIDKAIARAGERRRRKAQGE